MVRSRRPRLIICLWVVIFWRLLVYDPDSHPWVPYSDADHLVRQLYIAYMAVRCAYRMWTEQGSVEWNRQVVWTMRRLVSQVTTLNRRDRLTAARKDQDCSRRHTRRDVGPTVTVPEVAPHSAHAQPYILIDPPSRDLQHVELVQNSDMFVSIFKNEKFYL